MVRLIGIFAMLAAGVGLAGHAVSAQNAEPTSRILSVSNGQWSPSPDGRYAAYLETGNLTLRNLSTGEVRTLVNRTPTEVPSGALWSRDSQRVLFLSRDTTDSNGAGELRLIGVDRSAMRVVGPKNTYGAVSDWSPDGALVLGTLRVQNGQKFKPNTIVLAVATGSVQVVQQGALNGARFSPDGRSVVYTRNDSTSHTGDIYAMDLDGKNDRPLIATAADERVLGSTPDRMGLLFAKDDEIWLAKVTDGKVQGAPTRLKSHVGNMLSLGTTSAGDFYYRVFETAGVFRVTLDPSTGKATGVPTRVSPWSSSDQGSPNWSPDGRELAFTDSDGDFVSVLSVDTGQRRELHPDLAWIRDMGFLRISWSPDRRFILFDGGNQPAGTARPKGVYRLDSQSGEATMIVSKPTNPAAVSETRGLPGGDSLVYLDKWQAVVVRNLQGGEERVLYDSGVTEALDSLTLSPDGKSIAFRDHEKRVIQVLSLNGGSPRTVTSMQGPNKQAAAVTWSADGRFLIYSNQEKKDEPFALWRVPLAGGPPEPLGVTSATEISDVAARPGGHELAIVTSDGEVAGVHVIDHLVPKVEIVR